MKSLVKILAFIATFALAVLALHLIGLFVFGKNPELLMHHGAGQVIFYVLFVLNVFLFQKYVNRKSFLSLGLEPSKERFILLAKGWALGAASFIVYTLLMVVFHVLGFRSSLSIERVLIGFLVAFSGFTIALFEEILFRGFFLQTCLEDMPVWCAVVVTGIIFCFFHDLAHPLDFFTDPRQGMLFGGIFALNILLCYAYLKTGNLYLSVGIHSGLVFAKVLFRKGRFLEILNNDSWLWGMGGDARRGVIAWVFFVAAILLVRWILLKRRASSC
ncbi:MAG: type II CAAX endopeptidase family protein [Candidatus Omnitrophica bacterium]|nr:type II CAAX endopeptidase family protein [Candidatus Omnitrophota bacterium]